MSEGQQREMGPAPVDHPENVATWPSKSLTVDEVCTGSVYSQAQLTDVLALSSTGSCEIATKMAAVMSKIAPIAKGKKNDQQGGYRYRGIDDLYNAIQPLLAEQGVFVVPRMLSRQMSRYFTSKNYEMYRVVVAAQYCFVAPDGSHIVVGPVYGEGSDVADKATNKAMATAHKYALFQAFMIPTGDGDLDSESDRGAGYRGPAGPPRNRPPSGAGGNDAEKAKARLAALCKEVYTHWPNNKPEIANYASQGATSDFEALTAEQATGAYRAIEAENPSRGKS